MKVHSTSQQEVTPRSVLDFILQEKFRPEILLTNHLIFNLNSKYQIFKLSYDIYDYLPVYNWKERLEFFVSCDFLQMTTIVPTYHTIHKQYSFV